MASKQLELVARLAREQQDLAAQGLAHAQQQLDAALAQQRQILAYRDDYRAMARGGEGGSIEVRQLVEARRFLGEIDTIVASQQQQVEAAQQRVAQQQLLWADAARYTQSIEQLAKDRARDLAQAADKRLQQQLDDFYGQQRFFDL
ncbi:MAG: flagellar FliJ family protein [Halieaceae bacterium]|jgi:flagellar FliJ protein|nr:flagellar FliJ family protein [Halieaceae bacterium]